MRRKINTSQSLQRVIVGLTGLAVIVLIMGLASAIFSSASREGAVRAAGAARPDVVANLATTNSSEPRTTDKDPLAELGVAPSATTNSASPR